MDIYRESILLELRDYSPIEYNLFKNADITYPSELPPAVPYPARAEISAICIASRFSSSSLCLAALCSL